MNAKVLFILLVVIPLFYCRPDGSEEASSSYQYGPPKSTYGAPEQEIEASEDGEIQVEEEVESVPYQFSYAVKDEESGNDFSHVSDSDGSNVIGEYRISLSDGRVQIVSYQATKDGGYTADVKYEGEAIPYEPPVEEGIVEAVEDLQEQIQEQSSVGEVTEDLGEPKQSYGLPQKH